MGLGSVAVYSLAEARRKAADARRLVAEDIDPIEQRAALAASAAGSAAKAMTFEECADRYIAAHRAGWKNPKHARWPSGGDHISPSLAPYRYGWSTSGSS
jgi:hypothetical protein